MFSLCKSCYVYKYNTISNMNVEENAIFLSTVITVNCQVHSPSSVHIFLAINESVYGLYIIACAQFQDIELKRYRFERARKR